MKYLLVAAVAASISVSAAAAPQQPAAQTRNGFRSDFLAELDEIETKILQLAESTPERSFDWRPGKGIRSLGEVYGHMSGGNYFLATFLGIKTPADMPRDIEAITDKEQVVEELRKSFAHIRLAAMKATEVDLDKRVKMFGREVSHRFVYVRMLNHLHEHLGQAIAYARMNNIVPPWSQ